MPGALAVLHEALGASLSPGERLTLVLDFDRVFGLDFERVATMLIQVSPEEQQLLEERASAREERDWARSDELRRTLSARQLEVKDTPQGQRWVRRGVLPSEGRDAGESTNDKPES